jgi:alkanesulfonate monooxygenase SsuD/methylene tetrahydromethanopterin reductase-like flavin-dependent oxidoreductase (luciferase family)
VQLDILYNAARWTWPEIREGVVAAEADGYGTAWVYDHMSGAPFDGDRMLEAFSLAGALAAVTTTIGIGTLVVNAASRTPAMTVTAAASLQEISGGRFIFGLGAGAAPGTRWAEEFDRLELPLSPAMADRHARVLEVLDLCDAMWTTDREDRYRGFPLPSPRPPIHVGVNSLALARAVAPRCDAINVRHDHEQLEPIFAAALQARAASERPATPLSYNVWAPWSHQAADIDGDLQHRLHAQGVGRIILIR